VRLKGNSVVISKEVKNKVLAFGVCGLDFGVFATSKVVILDLIFSLIYYHVLLYCDLLCCFDHE
jgi:hypothetical protein